MELIEIIVHAPYIINIGNTTNPKTFELGVYFSSYRKLNEQKLLVQSKLFFTRVHMLGQVLKQELRKSLKD